MVLLEPYTSTLLGYQDSEEGMQWLTLFPATLTVIPLQEQCGRAVSQRAPQQDQPGSTGDEQHCCLHQQEQFAVLEGTARISVNGEDPFLQPGERLTVPARTPHTWGNGGQTPVRMLMEFRPALRSEDVMESLALLSSRGDNTHLVRPSILQMALLALKYEAFLTGPPIVLQRGIFLAR